MPKELQILARGRLLHSFALGESAVIAPDMPGVAETLWCGFRLLARDPEDEYALCFRDNIEEAVRGELEEVPSYSRGNAIIWDDRQYYESGVGGVYTTLFVRRAEEEGPWRPLYRFKVEVVPDKMETRLLYDRLLEDVRSVAANLIFDFATKNSRSIGFTGSQIRTEPSLVHLRRIEALWDRLTSALAQIRLAPAVSLTRHRVLLRRADSDPRTIEAFLRRGSSPGLTSESVVGLQLTETIDIYEHRLIKGFIQLLRERVETSGREAVARLRQMDENKPRWLLPEVMKEIIAKDYVPRMTQLSAIVKRCEALGASMRQVINDAPYRTCAASYSIRSTGVFMNVAAYNAVFRELIRYRNTSLWSLETGLEENIKLTSRMYEHWVFLQIAEAFRILGFTCMEQNGLFALVPGNAFQLDLDSGTAISFRRTNADVVRLRYEPWVPPQKEALPEGSGVYTTRRGPLHPDVLMEFGAIDKETGNMSIDYVVVVDAKYSKVVKQSTVDDVVGKYRSIGGRSRRKVAKQVWLAHPSELSARPEDDSLAWGKTYGQDEEVEGVVGLLPSETFGIAPCVIRFVRELLVFKGEDLPAQPT